MALHPLNRGASNHAITAKTYADLAERNADVAWQSVTANINKVVRITDTGEFHVLMSVGPAVWFVLGADALTAASAVIAGDVTAASFTLSALQTAPATAGATGTAGEIRIDATHIYVCTATDTWVRAAIVTW